MTVPTGDEIYRDALLPPRRVNEIIKQSGEIQLGRVRVSARGMQVDDALTMDEWNRLGNALVNLETSLLWVIADWIAYGNYELKVDLNDIAKILKRKKKTLQNWAWVARSIPFSRRKENPVTFGHHALVAGLKNTADQDRLLQQTFDQRLSVAEFRRVVQGLPPVQASDSIDLFVGFVTQLNRKWKRSGNNERVQLISALEQLTEKLRKEL